MAATDQDLLLKTQWYNIPKKTSKRPLGQDSLFLSRSKQTIGVADGVGGVKWADSGVYARELMSNAYEFLRGHRRKTVDPMSVLKAAFRNSNARGASTACIITLKGNSLYAVNLGDSGFRVIRGEKTVYKSPVQQVKFNCPFQLGTKSGFRPKHAEKIVVNVEPGDVLVAGTDGLFDNLFDAEIEKIVNATMQEGKASLIAARLGLIARAKSLIMDCVTPFGMEADKSGHKHLGGKYDDITVVVGRIY